MRTAPQRHSYRSFPLSPHFPGRVLFHSHENRSGALLGDHFLLHFPIFKWLWIKVSCKLIQQEIDLKQAIT